MRLDLYQAETERIAAEQTALLDGAADDLPVWNALVGIHNRIVHDYMNIDLGRIHALVLENRYRFVSDLLMKPI